MKTNFHTCKKNFTRKSGAHLCDKHKREHKHEFSDVHTVKQAEENLADAIIVTSEKIQ